MLDIGSSAPTWSGLDQDGKPRSSAEFAGQWLLFYFYPKDDTPGCTAEACGFRDKIATFADRITIVGVSADTVDSHRKFADKYQLPFTLIADPDRTIIASYGADGIIFPKRITFLIDPKQVIQKIYRGFDCASHAGGIDDDLKQLGR